MNRKLELGLTPRELQVAHLVREGLTDREIAEKLFITRRTAEWHLKQIFNKLGFNSRAQVAAWVAHDQAVGSQAVSSERPRHNLPLQLTTFVGRGKELAEIERLLATKRLVTLTAVGGAGKTRLALEVATRTRDAYVDGAWLVDLTPINEGRLVPRVFGSALGVHELPRQPMAQTVVEHLRGRRLLLLVDNCEHVIEDCAALVDAILRSCPAITFLATSREALRISGETVWRVTPLAVPEQVARIDLHELAQCEAVGLFLDRARLAAPDFEMTAESAPAIAQLCRRLDGIPLAIELAAARTGLMTPDQILNRLQDRFGLLTGGNRAGPARHRTLQSAIDWSYDLLSDPERKLFRRLSVFTGTFSLEAVEHACSGDDLELESITGLLGGLVDRSLVIAADGALGRIRFRLLDTLNQYGSERLVESDESERIKGRHCEYFVSIAEEAVPHLQGPEQRAWHQLLAHDLGNLRSALEWSSGHEPRANVRMSKALTDFWYGHGLIQEGEGWLKRALAGYPVRDELRAQALGMGGQISFWRDDLSSASSRWSEGLEIYRDLDDRHGIGQALRWVGELADWQGDLETAQECFDRSLAIAKEVDDATLIAHIFRHLGRLAMKKGNHAAARTFLEQSLSHYEEFGELRTMTWNLGYLGLNAIESGDFAAARSYLERALAIARDLDLSIPAASMLIYLGALASAQSHPVRALRLAGASASLAASAGAVTLRLTRAMVERWLDTSRRELGQRRSAACWAEGHAMTREHAIEYALNG
ncbi:MAG TPA: tetratricopeptide repeat protein [Candidatus Nitrosotalea sp.]|nr:tetratricopeptide repeat protein [Candidatus Nitrosotalea sp.]